MSLSSQSKNSKKEACNWLKLPIFLNISWASFVPFLFLHSFSSSPFFFFLSPTPTQRNGSSIAKHGFSCIWQPWKSILQDYLAQHGFCFIWFLWQRWLWIHLVAIISASLSFPFVQTVFLCLSSTTTAACKWVPIHLVESVTYTYKWNPVLHRQWRLLCSATNLNATVSTV